MAVHQVDLYSVMILKPDSRDQSTKKRPVVARHHRNMSTKMYVGNLTFDATEADVRELFSEHGPVNEVALVMDRETQRPRGFAFVTMNTKEGMDNAIRALNGKAWNGRPLTVNEARPREERPAYSGGGGGGRGGNRSGGRY
jgi:cold-inducible RNA-binding protein